MKKEGGSGLSGVQFRRFEPISLGPRPLIKTKVDLFLLLKSLKKTMVVPVKTLKNGFRKPKNLFKRVWPVILQVYCRDTSGHYFNLNAIQVNHGGHVTIWQDVLDFARASGVATADANGDARRIFFLSVDASCLGINRL